MILRGVAVAAALAAAPPADAACRLALALGLDVSGSVVGSEYRLQLDGLAEALTDPDVTGAILSVPGEPVALAVFEWSASSYQRTLLDWRPLTDEAAIRAAAAAIAGAERRPAPEATGIGSALLYAAGLFEAVPECGARVIDISGDGTNNDWPPPEQVRSGAALAGVTVNALAVVSDTGAPEVLEGYFRAQVIQGPGAFVERAAGYGDYARAIRKKLLMELTTLAVGSAGGAGGSRPGRADPDAPLTVPFVVQ